MKYGDNKHHYKLTFELRRFHFYKIRLYLPRHARPYQ